MGAAVTGGLEGGNARVNKTVDSAGKFVCWSYIGGLIGAGVALLIPQRQEKKPAG